MSATVRAAPSLTLLLVAKQLLERVDASMAFYGRQFYGAARYFEYQAKSSNLIRVALNRRPRFRGTPPDIS
jgi:hypothetical protein